MQRILATVGESGAASRAALRAATLSRATGADLRLVGGDDELPGSGERYEHVAAAARDFRADLLVVTGSATKQPARLTQAEWQIIRHSPCPVLFARGSHPAETYREILVAVDPMHAHDRPAALDDTLITLAAALARACNARLRLLHCYLPAEYLPLRAPGAVSSAALQGRDSSVEAHRAALHELARKHGLAPDAAVLEPADPRDAIPETAGRLGADLVVMGSIARSRLRRLLIGSTTEPVLDRLSCDFLVAKPADAVA